MSIVSEIDAAILDAQSRGVGLASMRLRMGPSAHLALASRITDPQTWRECDLPDSYDGVLIERVGAPGKQGMGAADENTFHGWELVA